MALLPCAGERVDGPADQVDDPYTVVERVRDGEQQAFAGDMYQLLSELALPIVRPQLPRSEWNDCVQDAIRKMYVALRDDAFVGCGERVVPFFRRIVQNEVINLIRRRRRDREVLSAVVDRKPCADPAAESEGGEVRERLRACLLRLAEKARLVILFRYLSGREYGFRDIEEELGIPHTTVFRLEQKALDTLRRCLKDSEGAVLPQA